MQLFTSRTMQILNARLAKQKPREAGPARRIRWHARLDLEELEMRLALADVSGHWQGTLTQRTSVFRFEMDLVQVEGEVTGTSRIEPLNQPQYYGVMSLTGNVVDNQFDFQEIRILEQRPYPGTRWLIKSGELEVLDDGRSITGLWFSEGQTGTIDLFSIASFCVYPDSGPAPAGMAFDTYILALDVTGELMPRYTGEIAFWSTDAAATLPDPYTFRLADRGIASFPDGVTFRTVGTQELYVFDTATYSVLGYAAFEVTDGGGAPGRSGSALVATLRAAPIPALTAPAAVAGATFQGEFLTATATTEPNGTSEFFAAVVVEPSTGPYGGGSSASVVVSWLEGLQTTMAEAGPSAVPFSGPEESLRVQAGRLFTSGYRSLVADNPLLRRAQAGQVARAERGHSKATHELQALDAWALDLVRDDVLLL